MGGGVLQSFGGGKSGHEKYKNKNTSRPSMASKRHEKRNNQPKMSGLDGREMEWDERTTGSQGEERDSIVLGAIELGGGGKLR